MSSGGGSRLHRDDPFASGFDLETLFQEFDSSPLPPAATEERCRKEFGFDVEDLRRRVLLHAEHMHCKLNFFCDQALASSSDAADRRKLGGPFITDMASMTKALSDHLSRTLNDMHSTFLANVLIEKDILSSEIAKNKATSANLLIEKDELRSELAKSRATSSEDLRRRHKELTNLRNALQRAEISKSHIEARARRRCEREMTLLQVSLRKELQACQICFRKPRSMVILPCFHGHFCAECLEQHQRNNSSTCPICRSIIRSTIPYIA